ncbi:Nucleotidylyl transferase [Acephala macrosclerotiorum]|nr:Nucleotidylyl transferase [Acephala macrosclerotiorum]
MASDISVQTPSPPTSQNAFPSHRLTLRQRYPEKTPLVLVACGSFSPITYLHLRMFEMASDYAKFNTDFEIMGGYLSPVGDAYKKAGLAAATHRLRMCELAVESAEFLMVDHWEAKNSSYIPTALVLDHFNHEINEVLGGAEKPDGTRVPMRIILLAGADLIQTMSTPGVWSSDDLNHILRVYGAFIVERQGTDIDDALSSLEAFRNNIYVIKQIIQNDVSSTKIRLFLRRELSIRYLVPSAVVEYIEENGLYKADGISSIEDKGKGKADG